MLVRIDMIAVYVRDWERALDFYTETLGFTAVFVQEHHAFAVLGLLDGGPTLHLVGDDSRPLGTRNRCVPNIAVDDFDTTLAMMRERDVEVLEVEEDDEDGYRLARLVDLEGNELNIYAVTSPST